MTDKKIEDYLERARTIVDKIEKPKEKDEYHFELDLIIIEIAKMIQLEEHREIQVEFIGSDRPL